MYSRFFINLMNNLLEQKLKQHGYYIVFLIDSAGKDIVDEPCADFFD